MVHYMCALECSWNGYTQCTVCRNAPTDVNPAVAERNRKAHIQAYNNAQREELFKKGMAGARAQKASKTLKWAVKEYKAVLDKVTSDRKRDSYMANLEKEAKSEFKKKAATFSTSVLKKYASKAKKDGFTSFKLKMRASAWGKARRNSRYYKKKVENAKKNVALAMGWVEVST